VGVVGSGAAHAAVLAALFALPLPASSVERTAARPTIARGEPILVRLVEPVEAVVEVEPPDDPAPPVAPSEPTDDEIAPPPPAVALVEPEPTPPPGRAVGRAWAAWLERMPVQAVAVAAPVETTLPVEPPPVEVVTAVEPAPAPPRPAPERPSARPATPPPPPTPTPPTPPPAPSGVETGAEVLHTPRPVYPRRSIRRGEDGTALVAIEVLADGRTGRIELRESSGHRRLDDAALDAAGRCRFRPATRDGRPVASTVLVPFEFELK
jgi:protein TonB